MYRKTSDIKKIFLEGIRIERALKQAAREAWLAHQRAGLPLVIWRDGKIRRVSAEDLLAQEKGRVRRSPSSKGRRRSQVRVRWRDKRGTI